VQFKTMPVDGDIKFLLQPDQAGPLGDVAERSDEVGIEADGKFGILMVHGHYYMPNGTRQ